MASSFNRVILVGNLTRDPELRYTPSGTPVCDIGLAVNDRRKNPNGEWVEETTFVDVTLWARTAEVASEYLGKGSQVLIEGRLKLDSWETDGQKRSKLKVVGERLQMLGAPRGGAAGGGGGGGRPMPDESEYSHDEEHSGPSGHSSGSRASSGRGAPSGRTGAKAPPPADDIPF
jgi:single-strand DNA-binding protein